VILVLVAVRRGAFPALAARRHVLAGDGSLDLRGARSTALALLSDIFLFVFGFWAGRKSSIVKVRAAPEGL
jgi:hypothetical protein